MNKLSNLLKKNTSQRHWEKTYARTSTQRLGWYAPHLQTSLAWIEELKLSRRAPIIDVGGGASTLVDDLLEADYQTLTILDLSATALSEVQTRLGAKSGLCTWLEGDITVIDLPGHYYELWHDRAVFHFLTTVEQQSQYRNNLLKALKPGGHLIIGTFAPEAPPKCSGLPVQRYTAEHLQDWLGDPFSLKKQQKELHTTPGGVEQLYQYCRFTRSE